MHEFIFLGKIHPERANLVVTGIPPMPWKLPGLEIIVTIQCSIIRSQVTMFCATETLKPEWIGEVKNQVLDFLYSFTNAITFVEGLVYTPERTTFIDVTQKHHHVTELSQQGLPKPLPSIAGDTEEIKDQRRIEILFLQSLVDLQLRAALADCRNALQDPTMTGLYCNKALEALRINFQSDKDKADRDSRNEGQIAMETALNMGSSIRKKFGHHGGGARHGKASYISGRTRWDLMTTFWNVVSRYIQLKKDGTENLDPNKFPKLEYLESAEPPSNEKNPNRLPDK